MERREVWREVSRMPCRVHLDSAFVLLERSEVGFGRRKAEGLNRELSSLKLDMADGTC